MYLRNRFYLPLAQVDDGPWQRLLARHAFWQAAGARIDAEHQDLAFHILMHEGTLADDLQPAQAGFEFDAVPAPAESFQDRELVEQVEQWAGMHAGNYGGGLTTKMGLYVIRAGG